MFIFADVAGQYRTMQLLLEKANNPKDFICLGDPNDRGPESRQVIEFLMLNGKLVQSNHAHMLIETWKQSAMPGASPLFYQKEILFINGGVATMSSYDPDWIKKINFEFRQAGWDTLVSYDLEKFHTLIPKAHIDFLESCPAYINYNNYIFSHAPMAQHRTLEQLSDYGDGFAGAFGRGSNARSDESLLWNRYVCERPHTKYPDKINIFGHNASDQVKVYCRQYPVGWKVTPETFKNYIKDFGTGDIWAICLDTSGGKKLTGLNLETMELIEQEYV